MKVEFTKRAAADLYKISADSKLRFGELVAEELETAIRGTIEQITFAPESGPRALGCEGVRCVALVSYPYRLFYRVLNDRVRILHVRHVSRRPWKG
jgi:toxin ParE1/3/4